MQSRLSLHGLAATLLLGACAAGDSPDAGILSPTSSATESAEARTSSATEFVEFADFESRFVKPRNISVSLPVGYSATNGERYPVIYAHDGQNLFDPATSYGGVEWQLDEAAERLVASGTTRPAIIVGIWNTDQRWQEYAPQKVIESLTGKTDSEWLGPELPELKADAYLRFIVEELKPFIDATFPTATDAENTFIMGSSMGGLISLYAVAEHPETFSRAAAVSIHWPLTEPDGAIANQADAAMQSYLTTSGIDNERHLLWFDRGTETLDAAYATHAESMEAWFRAQGWQDDQALFRAYPGTDHSEAAWADRADEILAFLLTEQ